MKHSYTAPPMSTAQRELERVRIVYEEDAVLRRVQTILKERIHETKIFEQSLALKSNLADLHNNELATLNILEDAGALEKDLAREHNRLTHIISLLGDGLLVIDNRHRILLANTVAATLLEIALEEMLGKNFADISTIWMGDRKLSMEERFDTQALLTGKLISISPKDTIFIETKGGVKFPASFTIAPFKEGEGAQEAVILFRADNSTEKNRRKKQPTA
ncbi:MAG: PAS domain-containing protein [Candidatus Azambacteria bacterium]|nr:PAS domain-containing protein [Candidatus Azambacteria bacterium]